MVGGQLFAGQVVARARAIGAAVAAAGRPAGSAARGRSRTVTSIRSSGCAGPITRTRHGVTMAPRQRTCVACVDIVVSLRCLE